MNQLSTILTLLLTAACPLCSAQDATSLPSRYSAGLARQVDADSVLVFELAHSKKKIEASLRDYLVAFNASFHGDNKIRVGVPLASMANDRVHLTYDLSGKNLVLQWKFAQDSKQGSPFNYYAYINQSGTASIVMNTRF